MLHVALQGMGRALQKGVMDPFEIIDAEWSEPEQNPALLLPDFSRPIQLARFQSARARLAQSVALRDMTRGRHGGIRVGRVTPLLRVAPSTIRERARAAEGEMLDDILGRPLRPFVPLRSI